MESFEKTKHSIEKPPVLYHASPNKDIEVFEPRKESVRDATEGPRVFATPDKAVAAMFLVRTNDSWAAIGTFDGTPCFVIGDKERFTKLDTGGAIYSLPNTSFETDVTKGLKKLEWTSTENVRPTGKEAFDSALEACINYGVQVYFVDKETLQAIRNSSDHGLSILRKLESENQKIGRNVRVL
jgi:hypothetical protein